MIKSLKCSNNLIKKDLEDLGISYVVKHRSVKYPRLEFKSEKELLVILPLDVESEHDLLAKKRKWIEKKYKSIHKAIESVTEYKPSIIDENKFLLFGKSYFLKLLYGKPEIQLNNNSLEISNPNDNISIPFLKKWLKTQLKHKITLLLNRLSKESKLNYQNVFIRIQKTKWASCSSQKNFNFNLKLIALPDDLIEYVVFHELNHLINKYHNYKFWKSVSARFPDYKKKEQLLTGFWFLLKENELWNMIEGININSR